MLKVSTFYLEKQKSFIPKKYDLTQRKMNGNKFKPKNPILYVLAQS